MRCLLGTQTPEFAVAQALNLFHRQLLYLLGGQSAEPDLSNVERLDLARCRIADAGLGGWVAAAIDPARGEPNDALCLDCHDLGAHPQSAHGFPPDALAAMTSAARDAIAGGAEERPFQAAVV